MCVRREATPTLRCAVELLRLYDPLCRSDVVAKWTRVALRHTRADGRRDQSIMVSVRFLPAALGPCRYTIAIVVAALWRSR